MQLRPFLLTAVTLTICLPYQLSAQNSPQPHHLKQKGIGFPDFGRMVSQDDYDKSYSDLSVFRLKTDFPTGQVPKELPAFMTEFDFKKDAETYLMHAQAYSFEGNLPAFGGGRVAWDPFANKVRPWYHIPWLHGTTLSYPPNGGTEGFRGMIKEAEVNPYQLAATQSGSYQVYAVTLVNEFAGHTLARMWKDPNNPDPRATDKRYDGGFPHGTVFAKLLFCDAPAKAGDDSVNKLDHVDYLQNGVDWQVYITESWNSPNFAVKTVRLLQMDMMMRDPRADRTPLNPEGTGWVFGTFAYNGAVANKTSNFLNLVPLGVMWGNSPSKTENKVNPYPPKPIADIVNHDLPEQKIFVKKNTPPQHLGWNSRLNGPADLNTSSCMSCHTTAQYPPVTPLVAPTMTPPGFPVPPALPNTPAGLKEWMKWFQNLECGTSFDSKSYSTDMSWQISISLQNFYANKARQMDGQWANEFVRPPQPVGRGGSQ